MCEVCITVYNELKKRADELEEQYPAAEISGQKVPRRHHVNTALRVLGENALMDELSGIAKIDAEEQGINLEEPGVLGAGAGLSFADLFAGKGFKISDNN